MNAATPYHLLGGEDGLKRLTTTFYQVMSERPEAATIRGMHAPSTEAVAEKLFQWLSGWMGGPMLYFEKHGTICISHPHQPYAIGEAERDAWLACFDVALDRIGASAEIKQMLKEPIFRVADMLVNTQGGTTAPAGECQDSSCT